MVKLILERNHITPDGIMGKLSLISDIDNIHVHSLELPWLDNIPNESCIVLGSYRAKLAYSDKFKRDVIRLEDALGRTNILIHPANHTGQLKGCIGVGIEANRDNLTVIDSVKAVEQLTGAIKDMLSHDAFEYGYMTLEVKVPEPPKKKGRRW